MTTRPSWLMNRRVGRQLDERRRAWGAWPDPTLVVHQPRDSGGSIKSCVDDEVRLIAASVRVVESAASHEVEAAAMFGRVDPTGWEVSIRVQHSRLHHEPGDRAIRAIDHHRVPGPKLLQPGEHCRPLHGIDVSEDHRGSTPPGIGPTAEPPGPVGIARNFNGPVRHQAEAHKGSRHTDSGYL